MSNNYYKKNGWHYLELEGEPNKIGYQHGRFLHNEIIAAIEECKGVTLVNSGVDWDFLRKNAQRMWVDKIPQEYLEEMEGIASGVNQSFFQTMCDVWDIIVLNGYDELSEYWLPTIINDYYQSLPSSSGRDCQVTTPKSFHGAKDHCSAFIATGDYTKDGKVVMAHNSFNIFELGNYYNVITYIKPKNGVAFKMQSKPGCIHSLTDFYINSNKIGISETTIGGFCVYDEKGIPEFVRIRKAIQYSNSVEEVKDILLDGNNGGYANTWIGFDLKTNEIFQLELGLKFHDWQVKTNDYFIGFNAPQNPQVRHFETINSGFADIRRHQGARQVRLHELMEKYKGKIDLKAAQKIIADHYDVYLKRRTLGNSRTVCSHYERDKREYMSQIGRPLPYQPRGAVDGMLITADMAENMQVLGRWGSSCGRAFDAKKFLTKHIQFNYLKDFLHDRPSQPWTLF